MSWVVALTGGIGSGKSTVARAFASLGIPIIDADVIARELVAPGTMALQAIVNRYSHHILLADGSLNRALLRQYIFIDVEEKNWLNKLLHPLIQQRTQDQIAIMTTPYILWVVPLLIEHELHHKANRILVIDVNSEVQISRTMARDSVTRQQVEYILTAQVSQQQRLACADDVIDNNGAATMILPLVIALHHQYLRLAADARQNVNK